MRRRRFHRRCAAARRPCALRCTPRRSETDGRRTSRRARAGCPARRRWSRRPRCLARPTPFSAGRIPSQVWQFADIPRRSWRSRRLPTTGTGDSAMAANVTVTNRLGHNGSFWILRKASDIIEPRARSPRLAGLSKNHGCLRAGDIDHGGCHGATASAEEALQDWVVGRQHEQATGQDLARVQRL